MYLFIYDEACHLKPLQLKKSISQYELLGFLSHKNKWYFLLIAYDHLFITTVLQTTWSQENCIYIRNFFFKTKFTWKWILNRPFNCGLLSRFRRENYVLEQSNNCLYTYSCVDGVAYCVYSKSYRTVSRIFIKIGTSEPTVDAICMSQKDAFYRETANGVGQCSTDVRAELLLSFLLTWGTSTPYLAMP